MPSPTTTPAASRQTTADHPGPPLGAPAVLFAVTFVASIAIGPIAGAGPVPSPFGDPAQIARYFADHVTVIAVSSFLMIIAALSLLMLAGIARSRLGFLAPNAPGPDLAGVGGVAAAVTLMISGIGMWGLARAATGRPDLTTVWHYLDFAAGGPVHTASLGVMVLGVSVTTLYLRRTPRVLSVAGIVLAVVDITSTAALVSAAASPLVPLGRFLTIAWLVAMALLIPRRRAARRPAAADHEGA